MVTPAAKREAVAHLQALLDVSERRAGRVPNTSISGKRVVRELTALIAERGKPGMIVSDNEIGRAHV